MNAGLRFVCVASCLGLAATTSRAADKVRPAVADALTPAPAGQVRLVGPLGEALETCRQGRMLGQKIPDLVVPFADRREDRFWQTEFWGKWFTSAALAYRYQPEQPLRQALDEAVAGLLKTQTPDGYIGNYAPASETRGWDIWGRKYVLLGLLAYYDLTGDRKALAAAVREADYTLGQLGPGKTDIVRCGMWTGMAASSILEPMVLLYRRTGEPRFLDFANYVVGQWQTPQGPDLVRKALAGTPVYEMFPGPDMKQPGYMSGGSSKAYEMMSCYEGLLELYRVTGKPQYLQAVRKVAADIGHTEITVIGSGSSWERWCRGRTRQSEPLPEWMETCVTATWLKLNAQLLRMTGEARYADEIEQTAYNALLAAQKPDGTWWCHYNPMEGIRQPAPEQCKMHMNCCVANGPRGLMLLPALAMMSGAEGPTINLYEPARATLPLDAGAAVTLEVSGDYLRQGAVEIRVRPDRAVQFTLSLRIPAWSRTTQVEVGGQRVEGAAAGTYLRLRRAWQAGDRIAMRFDMRARAVREPGGSGRVAVVRGPLVLAFDKRITRPCAGGGRAMLAVDAKGNVAAVEVRQSLPAQVLLAIDVSVRLDDGRQASLRMCDYASAGRTWDAASALRVWLPQPLDVADPFAGISMKVPRH